MDRRSFAVGAGAAMAAMAGAAHSQPEVDDLRTAAREAWIYGLPLIEMARLRAAAIGARPDSDTPGFNAFAHRREPCGPAERSFSAPEADLLYSSAWIDLAPSGAKLWLPPTGGRYFSLALFDMYGNAFEVFEGREIGGKGREFSLVGPPARVGMAGYSAPMPRLPHLIGQVVRAPCRWVWALARTHVEGEGGLAGAHQVQDGLAIRVKPAAPYPAPSAPLDAAWSDYFYAVQKLIEESPPPPTEIEFFRRIAPLQLSPAGDFERARFADVDLGEVKAGVGEAQTLAAQLRAPPSSDGWVWPKPDIGAYGTDFLYRARSVLAQSGAAPRAAVMALRAAAPDGALSFASAGHYRLSLPGPPPAAGFWSLTLYEAAPDGRLHLADAPGGRHSLGAWARGLRRNPDGGLDVWIGRTDPGGTHSANWLPAPASAPFALVLRAYAPQDDFVSGRYRPPPLETLAPGRRPSPH
ncbi:MAG TPA: DUF1254 domain-containing protein [Caulobacteraceae bacterium]|jgi:hypothetical protein